ncbi:MAG: CheR family methyltransferase [Bacteroidota bacterium]
MTTATANIEEILQRTSGMDISGYDNSFICNSIQKRITETGCGSPEAYAILVGQNPVERNQFIGSLTIGYSEFFRNSLTFSVLENIILPMLIVKQKEAKRQEIRLWSAACASGQEPYSMAILCEELKSGQAEKFNYRIFASDQTESRVIDAKLGHYTYDEISNLSLKRVARWFTRDGSGYHITKHLKNNIDFSVFDLFSESQVSPPASIFGDFDLVLCANILFYYKPGYRKKILDKVSQCLTRGGFLVTGETEREIVSALGYREVFPRSAIFQLKP